MYYLNWCNGHIAYSSEQLLKANGKNDIAVLANLWHSNYFNCYNRYGIPLFDTVRAMFTM